MLNTILTIAAISIFNGFVITSVWVLGTPLLLAYCVISGGLVGFYSSRRFFMTLKYQ